jgi:eukaryotic-like serine/threonine-protein kinase
VTGGWALHERTTPDRTVADASGTISVTVPEEWATAVDADGWTPPGQDLVSPAVAAGTGPDWRRDGAGLFVGLLRGSELPRQVPQHTECSDQRPAVADEAEGDPSITVVFTECPGVTVERVVHVTSDQLLWVQVRSDDRATANRVLDAVELHGM